MKKLVLALAAVGMVVGGTVACNPGPANDVTGNVVEREKEFKKVGKTYRSTYELDVVDAQGTEHEFKVSRSTYNDCTEGSHYPECDD